jgi:hypothetical protein
MAKRSIVFPEPKTLIGYATRTGLTFERFWKSIEAELAQRPKASEITIRGPKQTVTIRLTRDARKVEKQVFDDAKVRNLDDKNISDLSATVRKRDERTPWPLEQEPGEKPRYPVPDPVPNRFYSEETRDRNKLFYEKWAELNRNHNWPAWLVDDRDNRLAAEILAWRYPNILTSEEELRRASITLESVNVFLFGREPSEDSPLYDEKEKTIAKRVERFLNRDAKGWFKFQALIHEAEAGANDAEAQAYLGESYEQAKTEGDLKRIKELEEFFDYVPEDELDDDVVSLWRKRLDGEE